MQMPVPEVIENEWANLSTFSWALTASTFIFKTLPADQRHQAMPDGAARRGGKEIHAAVVL